MTDHYFSRREHRDFWKAGNFFHHRLSGCKFFPPPTVQTIFFKFSKSQITGVVSADNFSQMHLWWRQFSSATFLMQTIFFSIMIPQEKNNGPSLIDKSRTSLAHNSVFIGPNHFKFGTGTCCLVLLTTSQFGQIDHNLHSHDLDDVICKPPIWLDNMFAELIQQ